MVQKAQSSFVERYRLFGVIAFAILALVIFSGWMLRRGVAVVSAEKVMRQDIASTISTNGKIEPVMNFEAHAPGPATVRRVLVHEGDLVKTGQLLLELDDADARADAAKAMAQLRAAESDLHAIQSGGTQEEVLTTGSELTKALAERDEAQRNLDAIQRLQQKGAASAAEVLDAQSRLKKAQAAAQLLQSKQSGRYSNPEIAKVQASVAEARAAYAAAQDTLHKSNVRAPFPGTVYQLPVKTGSYVNTGDLLLQLANLDRVQVRAFVDEPEIGNLAIDEKVEVTWDAVAARTWDGVLTRVPTVVTALGTRTVGEVTCEIQNADRKLLPKVNVNVSIITARHPGALTVSRESVHAIDGKRYVYEIVDGKLRAQEVQTGISSLTRVEILKGISEGTEITRGAVNAQALHPGMDVKVVER